MYVKKHLGQISLLISTLSFILAATTANAQIEAIGTCTGVTTSNNYIISVTGLPAGTFTIDFDGVQQTAAASGSYSSAEQTFTDGTKAITVDIIDNGSGDTTTIIVHEVLCTDVNADGTFDFNTDVCDYTKALGTGGAIVSTVAPYNGDNVYLYILTDSTGLFLTASSESNNSGLFEDLPNGTYRVTAFNFLTKAEADAFVAAIPDNTDLDAYTAGAPACYAKCGDANYEVDCQSIVDIYVDPVDVQVCLDEDASFFVRDSFIIDPPANTTLAYQWQEFDGIAWSDVDDSNPPDSVHDISNVTMSDSGLMYRVIVTMNVSGSPISMDTSGVSTLTVYDDPVFASGLGTTVNSDDPIGIVLTLDPSSVAADSFELISVTFPGLTADPGNAVIGTTDNPNYIANDTYSNPDGGLNDTAFYEVVAISEQGCYGDTITILAIIRPCPEVADLTLTEVCSGDQIGLVLPSTDDNGISIDSFDVSASTGPGITGGPASTGVTTDVNFLAMDSFTNFTDVVDTVTYTITAFANDCESASFEAKVAVMPEPVFAQTSYDQCSDLAIGVALAFTDDTGLAIDSVDITASVGGTLTGTATTGDGITDPNVIAGDIFTNTTSATDTVVYTVTPYSNGCEGASYDIIVEIFAEPVGSDPAPTVCSDELISINLVDQITNGATGLTFTWFAIENPNVSGEDTSAQTTSTISDQISNVTGSSEVVIYKVIPQDGASCIGDTFNVSVTVLPEPVADDEALTVCSDDPLDIVITDNISNGVTVSGFTYTVTSSDQVNVPAGPDRTDTTLTNITDTYTNTTGSDVLITYTVTPVSTSDCAGATFDVDVTIKPEPVLSASLDTTVCSDSAIGIILDVEAGSSQADSFNIVAIDSDGLSASAGSPTAGIIVTDSSELQGDAWTNLRDSSVNVIYSVAPYTAGCVGDTVDIIVTIDPAVDVFAGNDTTICSNGFVDLALIAPNITGGTTGGTWSRDGGGTPGVFDDTDFATGTKYTPSDDDITAGSVTLRLTSDDPAGVCDTYDDTIVVDILDVRCSQFPWSGN